MRRIFYKKYFIVLLSSLTVSTLFTMDLKFSKLALQQELDQVYLQNSSSQEKKAYQQARHRLWLNNQPKMQEEAFKYFEKKAEEKSSLGKLAAFDLGLYLLSENNNDAAKKSLEKVGHPKAVDLLFSIAKITGDKNYIKKLAEQEGTVLSSQSAFDVGTIYYLENKFFEAERYLKQSQVPDAFGLLAEIALKQNRVVDAEKYLKQATPIQQLYHVGFASLVVPVYQGQLVRQGVEEGRFLDLFNRIELAKQGKLQSSEQQKQTFPKQKEGSKKKNNKKKEQLAQPNLNSPETNQLSLLTWAEKVKNPAVSENRSIVSIKSGVNNPSESKQQQVHQGFLEQKLPDPEVFCGQQEDKNAQFQENKNLQEKVEDFLLQKTSEPATKKLSVHELKKQKQREKKQRKQQTPARKKLGEESGTQTGEEKQELPFTHKQVFAESVVEGRNKFLEKKNQDVLSLLQQQATKENLKKAFDVAKELFGGSKQNKNETYQQKALDHLHILVKNSSTSAYVFLFEFYTDHYQKNTQHLEKVKELLIELSTINLDSLKQNGALQSIINFIKDSADQTMQLKLVEDLFVNKSLGRDVRPEVENIARALVENGSNEALSLLFNQFSNKTEDSIKLFEECVQKNTENSLNVALSLEFERIKKQAQSSKEVGRKLVEWYLSNKEEFKFLDNDFGPQKSLDILKNNADVLQDELAALQLGKFLLEGMFGSQDEHKAFSYFIKGLKSKKLSEDDKNEAIEFAQKIQAKNNDEFDLCKQLIEVLCLYKEQEKAFSLIIDNFPLITKNTTIADFFVQVTGIKKVKGFLPQTPCAKILKAFCLFNPYKVEKYSTDNTEISLSLVYQALDEFPEKTAPEALKLSIGLFFAKQADINFKAGNSQKNEQLAKMAYSYGEPGPLIQRGLNLIESDNRKDLVKAWNCLSMEGVDAGPLILAERFIELMNLDEKGFSKQNVLKLLENVKDKSLLFFKEHFKALFQEKPEEVFFKEFNETLNQLYKDDFENAEYLFAQGLADFFCKKYEEALSKFEKSVKKTNDQVSPASALQGYLLYTRAFEQLIDAEDQDQNDNQKCYEDLELGKNLMLAFLKKPINLTNFNQLYIHSFLIKNAYFLAKEGRLSEILFALDCYFNSYEAFELPTVLDNAFELFQEKLLKIFDEKDNKTREEIIKSFSSYYKKFREYPQFKGELEAMLAELYCECAMQEWGIEIFGEKYDKFKFAEKGFIEILKKAFSREGAHDLTHEINKKLERCCTIILNQGKVTPQFISELKTIKVYENSFAAFLQQKILCFVQLNKPVSLTLRCNPYALYYLAQNSSKQSEVINFFKGALELGDKNENFIRFLYENLSKWKGQFQKLNGNEAKLLKVSYFICINQFLKKNYSNDEVKQREFNENKKTINQLFDELITSEDKVFSKKAVMAKFIFDWSSCDKTLQFVQEKINWLLKFISSMEDINQAAVNIVVDVLKDIYLLMNQEQSEKVLKVLTQYLVQFKSCKSHAIANQADAFYLLYCWKNIFNKDIEQAKRVVAELKGIQLLQSRYETLAIGLQMAYEEIVKDLNELKNSNKKDIAEEFDKLLESLKQQKITTHGPVIRIPKNLLDKNKN